MNCPAINLTSVTVSYSPAVMGRSWMMDLARGRPRQPLTALRDIHIEVPCGGSVGIIGNNGAGKSTLLRVMAGILPATNGRVEINGSVTSLLNLDAGVETHLNGWDNIDLLAALQRIPRRQLPAFRDYVAEFSALGEALSRPVRTYSAGMLLRLIFSLRTFTQPDILVVDEVFGVGDRHFAAKAKERTTALLTKASSFALASHDPTLITAFCREAIWLDNGNLIKQGPAADVVRAYQASAAQAVVQQ
jgi:ABC-2 type transport system ATP-binding protein/lipopolysaccharide transport system ATP-binding protein